MLEQHTSGGNTPLQASDELQHIEDSLVVYQVIGGQLVQIPWNELPEKARREIAKTSTIELL